MLITGGAPAFMRSSLTHSHAETSETPLWAPGTKVAGRYLGPYLARVLGDRQSAFSDLAAAEPGGRAERERAVALILAAADTDAAHGDLLGAMSWLSLVERLDLVIPPEYVAHRERWRRQLEQEGERSAAAERIDPSLRSTEAALNDLRRRVSWLREVELKTTGKMRDQLRHFDEDMDHLEELSRRTHSTDPNRNRG
jgi:hypothetical protein